MRRFGSPRRDPAIFRTIAATLLRHLPAGWSTAWVYSEMNEHDGGVVVYYLDDARRISWITPPLALYDHFRELNNAARTTESGQPWTTATFALEPDGRFHIDYGYDPVPIEDEAARRSAWKARYLPPAT